jgi:hypothetical protein
LISNEPLYLRHFASIFEELWKNGIGADDRIRHIEERVDSAVKELVPNPKGDSKSVEQHKSCNRRSINNVFFGKRIASSNTYGRITIIEGCLRRTWDKSKTIDP